MPNVISRIGADTADALQIHDDQLGAVVTRWDYRGRRVAAAAAVPTVAAGAGAGTGATASVTGDDSAHRVAVTTGGSGTGAGILATITLSAAFTNTPYVALAPRD